MNKSEDTITQLRFPSELLFEQLLHVIVSHNLKKKIFHAKALRQHTSKICPLQLTQQKFSNFDARSRPFRETRKTQWLPVLPSPSSPCVRTAMANNAIPNSLSHGLFRGPTLAALLATAIGKIYTTAVFRQIILWNKNNQLYITHAMHTTLIQQ